MYIQNRPRLYLCVTCDDRKQLYLAIGPAQLDLVHPPQFVDVFCQLVPDVVQVRGQNDLQRERQGGTDGASWMINRCQRDDK